MIFTMSLNFPPPPPNLQYLPAELVDEIAQYLLPISKLSLRYTCHRFRHYFSVTMESLRKEFSIILFHHPTPWLDFLYMLERDQSISQLVCNACNQTHHISLFSKSNQAKIPRRCLASEGEPWICPHRSYTRAEISLLRLRAQSHSRRWSLLVDVADLLKVWCLWLASLPGFNTHFPAQYCCSCRKIKFKFPAQYDCSCQKITRSQHMLYFHIEASKFRLLQARVEKALGMSTVVKCVHLRNPTKLICVKHENCLESNEGDPSFRCRLCMDGVINDVSM